MKALFSVFLALAVTFGFGALAKDIAPAELAQPQCSDTLFSALAHLKMQHGEEPVVMGVIPLADGRDGKVLFVGNPAGTSWTVLGHVTGQPWCVLSDGAFWQTPDAEMLFAEESGQ